MGKAPEIPSVQPYLNFAGKFIADMEKVLAGNEKLLRRQKHALKAIDTVIAELVGCPLVGCPRGQEKVSFMRSTELRVGSKK